ncbi:hypothetical protein [Propionispora hippei]|uniref:Uncharacterized protein n=1 Tax=Propionispora hippei DSM 15287 TaxID=1123003 RepID=A0A1M6I8W9_9FIRM|nr:hypothetical protein [Propionispora hippei]SHJ30904.1 hypothetical protein SAMN02745170_02229 [Propionispora hippei DSM 15287]
MQNSKKAQPTVLPSDKVYKLLEYTEVLVEGKKENFLIRIEKQAKKSGSYRSPGITE